MATLTIGTPTGTIASGYKHPVFPFPSTGLRGWWDADDPTTITHTAGAVSQWRDKSGNNKHFGQTTPAMMPMTGTATQNGHNVVYFDGNDDYLDGFPPTTATSDVTMFVACKTMGTGGASVPFMNGAGSNGYGIAARANDGLSIGMLQGGIAWIPSSALDPSAPCVMTLNGSTSSPPVWTMLLNGASILLGGGNSQLTVSTPTAARLVNPEHQWRGQIYEAMIFSPALSAADRQAVEAYLMDKWLGPQTLPLKLPWALALWASDSKWVPPADGARVASWRNAGTIGGVSAGQAGNEPIYRASSANLNSKPAVEFDGVNTYMAGPNITPGLFQPNHIFAVAYLDADAPDLTVLVDSFMYNKNQVMIRDGGQVHINAGGTYFVTATNTVPKGSATAISAVFNGATSKLRVLGTSYPVPVDIGTYDMAGDLYPGLSYGGAFKWKGRIAFIGVCDRELTSQELLDLEDWARTFYNVPIFRPNDLAGLAGWWDAARDADFTYSSGNDPANPPNTYVSQWKDRSGLNRHLVGNANLGYHPKRVATINGLKAVDYSPGYVNVPKGLAVPSLAMSTTKPSTYFMVVKPSSLPGDTVVMMGPPDSGLGLTVKLDGALRLVAPGIAEIGSSAPGASVPGTPMVVTSTYSATGAWTIRKNGVQLVAGTTDVPFSATKPFGVGADGDAGSSSYQGVVGEAIIYNAALSAADITKVETYLKSKWGTS